LIREGSGYWKYLPSNGDGQTVRFLTSYDYSVRFGRLGRLFDKFLSRPMLGWATAWSFDRLRLWIERGFDPAASMRRSLVYLTARLALAFVWLYQGIVPKLILRHPDELALLRNAGLSVPAAGIACAGIGCFEVVVGLALLLVWRSRLPLWLTLVAMPIAALAVAVTRALGLPRGYWVTLTAVIILQPWGGATLVKALQRVLGTVAGGVLTALLGALIHDQRPFLAIIFVFAAVITPSSDPFSFTAMAVPMLIFYELAIIVGRLLKK